MHGTCFLILSAAVFYKNILQFIQIHWLGKMVIHAAGEGFLHVFPEGVSRDSDNGYRAGIFAGKAAYSLCCLISMRMASKEPGEEEEKMSTASTPS